AALARGLRADALPDDLRLGVDAEGRVLAAFAHGQRRGRDRLDRAVGKQLVLGRHRRTSGQADGQERNREQNHPVHFDLPFEQRQSLWCRWTRLFYAKPPRRVDTRPRARYSGPMKRSYARLTRPLVRDDGILREASWDEALDRAAAGLRATVSRHGPRSF